MEKNKDLIENKVKETPFIDTHEHLIDESERLDFIEPIIPRDDWALLLNHYFSLDLISSGISKEQIDRLFSNQINPIDKWQILKEFWPFFKNTASGLVFRSTIKILYDIDEISEDNIIELQSRYEQTRKKEFYKYIIQDIANIKHCHINSPIITCKNAYWSWSINPLAAKDFLKKFTLTILKNKIFTFGGDDKIVENLIGHASVARKGIAQALTELVFQYKEKAKRAAELTITNKELACQNNIK